MSKTLNDQLIDLRSKKHQEYIKKFKRIDCSTDKVCNDVFIVNDINPSKSTYGNICEVNKKYESKKEKDNNDAITWKHGTCLVFGDSITA